jgi:HD-GYP domain-containing protein (c-di-GMP phosphodiesterase class II)
MTIADIFDALTAWDRPYKKAVPFEHAIDILNDEAKHNKVDPEILKVFISAEIYKKFQSSVIF